jgi:hypothetical protein
MERRKDGILEYWKNGKRKDWDIGMMEEWNDKDTEE